MVKKTGLTGLLAAGAAAMTLGACQPGNNVVGYNAQPSGGGFNVYEVRQNRDTGVLTQSRNSVGYVNRSGCGRLDIGGRNYEGCIRDFNAKAAALLSSGRLITPQQARRQLSRVSSGGNGGGSTSGGNSGGGNSGGGNSGGGNSGGNSGGHSFVYPEQTVDVDYAFDATSIDFFSRKG